MYTSYKAMVADQTGLYNPNIMYSSIVTLGLEKHFTKEQLEEKKAFEEAEKKRVSEWLAKNAKPCTIA